MMVANVQVTGVDDLLKKFKRLDKGLRGKAARAATAKAATHVRDKIKPRIHLAPQAYKTTLSDGTRVVRLPGDLSKTLIVKYQAENVLGNKWSQHVITFHRKNLQGIGNVAHLIENGVKKHDITRNGHTYTHPGHQPFEFFEKSLNAEKPTLFRIMEQSLHADIQRLWRQS